MSDGQRKALNRLAEEMGSTTGEWIEYWQTYSYFDTWQFWVTLFLFIAPLIALAFLLDRRKAFRIGFFGFGVHMVMAYIDSFGTTHGLWEYPFRWMPALTNSLGLDASLVPVAYMLLYQWTIRRNIDYYLFMIGLSAVFAFGIKPLLVALDLFRFFKGTNYLHLFVGYLALGAIPKWITDLFGWYQSKAPSPT